MKTKARKNLLKLKFLELENLISTKAEAVTVANYEMQVHGNWQTNHSEYFREIENSVQEKITEIKSIMGEK